MSELYKELEEKMKKAVENFKYETSKIRTGRATPAILESIKVDYYGSRIPINQIASILAPDPRLLIVQPWDQNSIGEIEKAIKSSGLGLNPQIEKGVIKVPIPPLSEERRKELIKLVQKLAEDSRVAIRNIRRDGIERAKSLEKEKKISEDDRKMVEKKIQELTDKYIAEIDKILSVKEKEILEE
ncbi:MAG: ribosome recycling factor [candidate division WOR-3 bacterium]